MSASKRDYMKNMKIILGRMLRMNIFRIMWDVSSTYYNRANNILAMSMNLHAAYLRTPSTRCGISEDIIQETTYESSR